MTLVQEPRVRAKRIEAAWLSYLEKVVPEDAGEVHLAETRRAFVSGAVACFSIILRGLTPGPDATEADMSLMDDLQAEFEEEGKAAEEAARKAGG